MDIVEISEALGDCTTQSLLEEYIDRNIKQIRLHFYNKQRSELEEQRFEFESIFYDFKSSGGFREFIAGGAESKEIGAMLIFFASIFERIHPNPIFEILDIVPKRSIYYRLKAHLCAYEEVNDLRTHYTSNLTRIFTFLSRAQYDEEEDYTAIIISFLVKLYNHVVLRLTGRGLHAELRLFISLFRDRSNVENYHFLSHPQISRLLAGELEGLDDLVVSDTQTSLYYPSDTMQVIFREEIIDKVKAHPQTRFSEILLGYSAETIRRDIIEYGRADFRSGFKGLSASDKVLLYCYFNMRKHFFTSLYLFGRIYQSLLPLFERRNSTLVFIDLGCGPLTSGLAIADLHHQTTNNLLKINYVGVDIAEAMLDKARDFTRCNIFDEESKYLFVTNWREISDESLREFVELDNPIVINASYLFASELLNENHLAEFISGIVQKYRTSKIYFTYQNPYRKDRNGKYDNFKGQLNYAMHKSAVERVLYKNNFGTSGDPSAEDVYFEILELK